MRVLQVLPTFNPRYGGPVYVGMGMSKTLSALGAEIRMVSADGEVNPKNISLDKYDVDNQGRWGYCFNPRLFPVMKRLLNRVDLVHIHGLWNYPASLAAGISRYYKIPYIVTPHGMLTSWSMKQSIIKKSIYSLLIEKYNIRKAAGLHFISEEEVIQSEKWGSNACIFVLPNGVDNVCYNHENDRQEIEKLYPILNKTTTILFLGRLHPGKGLDLLLPAFRSLCSEYSGIRLVIAGPEAEYSKEMFRLINELDISDKIVVTGLVKGEIKRALLGGSDIFILPSRHEGDSISIKEACLAGLPIVITPHCHFPLAEEKGVAIVVNTNIEEIRNGIRTLIANPFLRREMGNRGRNLILELFTWDRVGMELIKAYRGIYEKFSCKKTF